MINEENLEKVKNLIKKEDRPIIIKAKNDSFNRKLLEYGKFDILLSPESENRKDKLKQVDSGLNEISARIATKNNITIALDLEEINSLNKKEKAVRLARLRQNIRILRKTKTNLIILNSHNKRFSSSLLLSLGASTLQAKKAISF